MRITPTTGHPAPDWVVVRSNPNPFPDYARRRDKLYFIPAFGVLKLGLNMAGTEYNQVLVIDGVREVSRDEIRKLLVLAADMI